MILEKAAINNHSPIVLVMYPTLGKGNHLQKVLSLYPKFGASTDLRPCLARQSFGFIEPELTGFSFRATTGVFVPRGTKGEDDVRVKQGKEERMGQQKQVSWIVSSSKSKIHPIAFVQNHFMNDRVLEVMWICIFAYHWNTVAHLIRGFAGVCSSWFTLAKPQVFAFWLFVGGWKDTAGTTSFRTGWDRNLRFVFLSFYTFSAYLCHALCLVFSRNILWPMGIVSMGVATQNGVAVSADALSSCCGNVSLLVNICWVKMLVFYDEF